MQHHWENRLIFSALEDSNLDEGAFDTGMLAKDNVNLDNVQQKRQNRLMLQK